MKIVVKSLYLRYIMIIINMPYSYNISSTFYTFLSDVSFLKISSSQEMLNVFNAIYLYVDFI